MGKGHRTQTVAGTARRVLIYTRLSSHGGESDPSTSPERQGAT